MKRVVVSLVVALTLLATGCAPNDSGDNASAADCSQQVRLAGVVYTSHGYTERDATKYATADRADCDDVGKDAAGSVFPTQPRQVTTWTFHGYPPEEVLGVRFGKDSFAVFVADSVALDERDRIFRELSKPTA